MRKSLFVDLSNFYGNLLFSKIAEPTDLRAYFINWFDFDRLSYFLTGEFSDIWIFYSGQKLGPSDYRINGGDLNGFIERINKQKGVTARDVNIPGEQREYYTTKCEKCGEENKGEWISEKGIDASLTVHLFDTSDSWETAILISGDADFVPVVESMRKKGKVIIGAGFINASRELIKECYEYVDLAEKFICEDFGVYKIFCQNGFAESWLTKIDESTPGYTNTIKFWDDGGTCQNFNIPHVIKNFSSDINKFLCRPQINFNKFQGRKFSDEDELLFNEFFNKLHFSEQKVSNDYCGIVIQPISYLGFIRRYQDFIKYPTFEDLREYYHHELLIIRK
jgi:uncharacterized LabA/DUF88 family protein